LNYAFLDDDVKQAVAGTKLTVKDLVTKEDVRLIEREYLKREERDLIGRYGVTARFDKVKHHFERALEAVDKGDFVTMFAERDVAYHQVLDILNPPQPIPGYKKVREVATKLGHSYADALCEKLRAIAGK